MNNFCVLLDNGHGYDTMGKCSPQHFNKRVYEWYYNRKIVEILSCELFNRNINNKIITPEVEDISLTERVKRINDYCRNYNCILISIHLNASKKDNCGTGFEVFSTTLNNNSDKLANMFVKSFSEILPNQRNRGHKECDYYILNNSNCTCVLTENFFMNNKSDVDFLLSYKGFKSIIDYHIRAIQYFIECKE